MPLAKLALTTTLVLSLLACGGAGPASTAAGVAGGRADGPRDTLVVAAQADLGYLNPAVAESATDSDVLANLILPVLDSAFDCRLTFHPALSERWEFSEGDTVITHHLRPGVTWSDGTPVTAHDVVFLFDLVKDPSVASPRLAYTEHLAPGSPKALDDHTVEFRFTHAYDKDTMLAHTASLPPVPKHVFESADRATLRGHPATLQPLSSGPWRVKTREKGSRYVLEPNPAYSGPEAWQPKLARIVLRVIPEYATRLGELKHGGVDLMEGIDVPDVDRLRAEHPEIQIASRGYRTMDYVAWNLKDPLFADPSVRKALTLAVDVDGMIARLLTGADGKAYAKPAVSTFTPELCALADTGLARLPHDVAQSRALLAAAGWTDHDGDGWVDKDGKPFTFTLTTNSGNKRRADASVLLQASLKEVGVKVELEQRESNTFFEALRKRDFQAALAGWSAALFLDPTPMWHCDRPDAPMEFNFTGYCSAEADRLIEQALATPDPEVAAPLWRALQARIYEDQPYTFLWWREELVGVSSRFSHREIDVLSALHHLSTWEVPPDKVKYGR